MAEDKRRQRISGGRGTDRNRRPKSCGLFEIKLKFRQKRQKTVKNRELIQQFHRLVYKVAKGKKSFLFNSFIVF